MLSKFLFKNSKKFNLFSAFSAFFIWGGWAFYINGSSIDNGLISGLYQGVSSFVTTLFMAQTVTWFFNLLPKKSTTFLIPAILTICIIGSSLFTIHRAIDTPEIFYTILPSLTAAFVFCLFVTFQLKTSQKE
jgi:hypothetical protein